MFDPIPPVAWEAPAEKCQAKQTAKPVENGDIQLPWSILYILLAVMFMLGTCIGYLVVTRDTSVVTESYVKSLAFQSIGSMITGEPGRLALATTLQSAPPAVMNSPSGSAASLFFAMLPVIGPAAWRRVCARA